MWYFAEIPRRTAATYARAAAPHRGDSIQSASLSVSPVRIRRAWSIGVTKILPSPIWPVRALEVMTCNAFTFIKSERRRSRPDLRLAQVWHLSVQLAQKLAGANEKQLRRPASAR